AARLDLDLDALIAGGQLALDFFCQRGGRLLQAYRDAADDLRQRAAEVLPERLVGHARFQVPDGRLDSGLRHVIAANARERVADFRGVVHMRRGQHRRDVARNDDPGRVYRLVVEERVFGGCAFAIAERTRLIEHTHDHNPPPRRAPEARFKRVLQRQPDLSQFDSLKVQSHNSLWLYLVSYSA